MEQNEQKQFICTGNCIGCSVSQRAFCASQHSYRSMRMLNGVAEKCEVLERKLIGLSEKIDSIISSDEKVFAPDTLAITDESDDIAQEGDGAEE